VVPVSRAAAITALAFAAGPAVCGASHGSYGPAPDFDHGAHGDHGRLELPAPAQTAASRFALAIVLDPRGRALVDVGADDFVIEEAGEAREILSVRVADYPVAVLVDNGGAARTDYPRIQKAVGRFVERLGPRPVALVSLGLPPKLFASFEDQRPVVLERLQAMSADGSAESQPLHAAALAAERIRSTGALFSTLIVVTASPVETGGVEAESLIAPVIDSRAAVHVIARRQADGSGAPDAGGSRPLDLLRDLAEQTHGRYTAIYSSASYQPALDRLADRLTTELIIEYIVPVGSKPSDVKVGVRIPGARVLGMGVAPR
jgi:hypothetical protein